MSFRFLYRTCNQLRQTKKCFLPQLRISPLEQSKQLGTPSIYSFHRSLFTSNYVADIVEIKTPGFPESVTEGDITFVKKIGDVINVDEVVAQIETDKTTLDVMSSQSGKIVEILVDDGSTIRSDIVVIKLDNDVQPPTASVPSEKPIEVKKIVEKMKEEKPVSPSLTPSIPKESKRVEIKEIIPENKVERIKVPDSPMPPPLPIISDIDSKIAARHLQSSSRNETRTKMSRMRIKIAERLKEAQNTCAMLTTFNEIDMSNIAELRKLKQKEFMKKHNIKLGFMSAFVKASCYALQDQPTVNAVIEDKEIVYRDYIDISIAVSSPKGLVVPVMRNAELMDFADIEKSIIDLGTRAQGGNLSIEDMQGGTFTISNGGVFGSLFGTPIINPPQSAILGMHGIFDRPVAINGKMEIRPMMYVALTYDHRLIDGREAVSFLRKIKAAVEDPQIMFLAL
ncbi:hypothetical protein SNEBB_004792 [Seison nebaliae]|nr:hypothetical protein SNEBB_004792 [Seison nebaliae]